MSHWQSLELQIARKRIAELESDIAKYRARLEVDHFYVKEPGRDDLVRQDVPYTCADDDIGSADGISCRDATIALLEDDRVPTKPVN